MTPFDCIFFDSEPLIAAQWPTVTTPLRTILNLAHHFEVALFLPEATERELEEHRLRDYDQIASEAISRIERLTRVFSYLGIPSFEENLPDRETVRQRYREAVETIKQDWGVESIPLTNRTIDETFAMAVRRDVPFKAEGAGFQDYIIFASVVDHLSGADRTGAFVTRDGTIQKHKDILTAFAKGARANVMIYESLAELEREFEKALDVEIRALMDEDRQRATETLMGMRAEIGQFIQDNIGLDGWDAYQGKVLEIRKVEVLQIEYVLTNPLKNDVLSNISFHAVIKARVLIEKSAFNIATLLGFRSAGISLDTPQPTKEEVELEKRVELEARGIKADPERYDRIELVSAVFKTY